MAPSHDREDGSFAAETNSDHDCVFDYDRVDEHVESMEPYEAQCDCCIEEALRLQERANSAQSFEQICELREPRDVVAYYFDGDLLPEALVGADIPDLTLCIECHRDEDYEHIFEDPQLDTIHDMAPGVKGMASFNTPWGKLVSYYEDVRITDVVEGPNVIGETVSIGREGYTVHVPSGVQVFDSPLRRRMIEEIAREDYCDRHPPVDEEKMRGGY